jgi:hypothetical protein
MVSKAKAMGMPTGSVAAARAWRRRHLDPAHTKPEPGAAARPRRQLHRPPSTTSAGGHDDDTQAETTLFETARARRVMFEAQVARLRFEQAIGRLVDAEELRGQLARRVAATRDALLRIPQHLAPELLGATEDHIRELLHRAFRDALAALDGDDDHHG